MKCRVTNYHMPLARACMSPLSYLEEVVGRDHFFDENHVNRGVALLVRHDALQLMHHVLGRLMFLQDRRGGKELVEHHFSQNERERTGDEAGEDES